MPLSEDKVLEVISRYFPQDHPSLLRGRGDDCAVIKSGLPLAVSTDIFAEGSHFRTRYFSPADIGYKALAVNISDLGAAGAAPEGCSVGLTLTGGEDEAWLCGFCSGMKALADDFGMALSGGDLTRASLRSVCITAWGRLPEALARGLRRGVSQEGDDVFLCGPVGLARAGLMALESMDAVEAKRKWPTACHRHLRPFPLAHAGTAIGRFAIQCGLGDRIGLMDVSDGLARDLPRLLAKKATGLGADILLSGSMLPEEVRAFARLRGEDPAEFAFIGGEDYALAGTCPADAFPRLCSFLKEQEHSLIRIGTVQKGKILLNGKEISGGFDHFA